MTQLDHLVSKAARAQHGVFSVDQIPGGTRGQIATRCTNGRWSRAHKDVFVIGGSPDTWEQRLWIRLLVAGRGAVVGSRSALALHHVRGMGPGPIDVLQPEVTVPNAKPRTSRRTTRLPTWQVTDAEGFPVTTVERSLFDLAGLASQRRRHRGLSSVSEQRVARTVDHALSQGLVTVASLRRVHRSLAGRGRPGSRLMRELIEARSDDYVPTDSELEDLFLRVVIDHGLPTPQRQMTLGSVDNMIGRVDFYYEQTRLVVEVDSRSFHSGWSQTMQDHQRDLELMAEGWQVLRIDWHQLVDDGPKVAALLERILSRRTSR